MFENFFHFWLTLSAIIDNSNVLSGLFIVILTALAAKEIFLNPRFKMLVLLKEDFDDDKKKYIEFILINKNPYTTYYSNEAYVKIFLPQEFFKCIPLVEIQNDGWKQVTKLSDEYIEINGITHMGNNLIMSNCMFPLRPTSVARMTGNFNLKKIKEKKVYFAVSSKFGTVPRKLNTEIIAAGKIPEADIEFYKKAPPPSYNWKWQIPKKEKKSKK